MRNSEPRSPNVVAVGFGRAAAGLTVIAVVGYAYTVRVGLGDGNPFDYFGYFTNQTTLLAGIVLIITGILMVTGQRLPAWLTTARAVATACIVVVAVIYNGLVPGTGTAPLWVSATLHTLFPLVLALDWLIVGDRSPQPWRTLWLVLPYPVLWLTIVLLRGVTDGWVPYGFLLPARGGLSLFLHLAGLIATLIAAAALVWAISRTPGVLLRATDLQHSRPIGTSRSSEATSAAQRAGQLSARTKRKEGGVG